MASFYNNYCASSSSSKVSRHPSHGSNTTNVAVILFSREAREVLEILNQSYKSPEFLLQLLQSFIKKEDQVKQIHSLLITEGYLLYKPNRTSSYTWKPTLFYNTLIRAHLFSGQTRKTLQLFILMLSHQTPPNSHTFPPLIKAATLSSPYTGASLHSQALKRGILCDPFIQTSLLALYSQLGNLFNAHKMFDEVLCPCSAEYNAMIDAYVKNGDMDSAVMFFETMPKRDVISWTTIINGFARNGLFSEGIVFFRTMMLHDDVTCHLVKPNEATYVSLLSSCANLGGGASSLGKELHGYMMRNEVSLTVFMGTALVDFYGKVGSLQNAIKVFNKMVVKKVCTWNALISSLANNGKEMQALNMFERMKVEGLNANEITYVAVLTACARAKLIEFGLKLFQSMWSKCGVLPGMEHYGCIVDLLGRAGLLREASEFINSMPFEPDASVVGALLGACKIHGSVELGNEVGRRLLQLQPQYFGVYMGLSNINALAERWCLAADVRKSMLESGVRKFPAYSIIDSM